MISLFFFLWLDYIQNAYQLTTIKKLWEDYENDFF